MTKDDIYCFSYTSGTTGVPKGAMISHKNFTYILKDIQEIVEIDENGSYLSYLPMAHILERICYLCTTSLRAIIYISSGNIRQLGEDLKLSKPMVFISVPRLFNKFYDIM